MIATREDRGLTERAIRAYVEETATWKDRGGEPEDLLRFEEFLSLAAVAFDAVSRWDAVWHRMAHAGVVVYDEGQYEAILKLYADWLEPDPIIEEAIRRFEHAGFRLSGADLYYRYRDEAKAIQSPSEEIGGAMAHLADEALAADRRGDTSEMTELTH